MIEVSLLKLAVKPNARDLWPDDFLALVAEAEAAFEAKGKPQTLPLEKTADWCDEHGESALSEGFRWIAKKLGEGAKMGLHHQQRYVLEGLPAIFGSGHYGPAEIKNEDYTGMPGLAAAVVDKLARLRKQIE